MTLVQLKKETLLYHKVCPPSELPLDLAACLLWFRFVLRTTELTVAYFPSTFREESEAGLWSTDLVLS